MVGEGHVPVMTVSGEDQPRVLAFRAERAFGLSLQLALAGETVEVVQKISAHKNLNGSVEVTDGNALLKYFVAIDMDELLRHAGKERGGRKTYLGTLLKSAQVGIQIIGQKLDVSSRAILQHEGKSAGVTDSRDRGRGEIESYSVWELA